MLKSMKKAGLIALIAVVAAGSMSFTSSYFEISKNLDIFASLYKELNTYYVDEVEPADLMRKGIDAMLKSLDPYTNYISEAEIEGYKLQTTGKYGGIGAAIRKDKELDYVVISEPYEGFPAHKAGLRAGDAIKEIEGKSAKGKTTDEISKILRGNPGTDVKIKIGRPGESRDLPITLTRETVKIDAVPYSGVVRDDIGYIKLNSFTQNCGRDVANAYQDLKKDHDIKGLIFDLRGNPGGLLSEAVNVSNIFVDKGEEIVSTKGKIKEWEKSYKAKNSPVDLEMPIVVLTNKSSASASEIVSGVVQDLDRGIVLGQRTYGKGLVQTTKNVGYNSKLKLTTAKYYIPSGRCIQSVDYAIKNKDGSVDEVPDSLRTAFKTRNGRKVFDGGGVLPDVELERKKYAKVSSALASKQLIFKYATDYFNKHDEIDEPEEFSLSDEEYDEFVNYISGKDYSYTTKSEKLLKDFKKSTEVEEYYKALNTEIDELEAKFIADKRNDLVKHKDEIKELIEMEIIGRYYYKKGKIRASLQNDDEVAAAIELLTNNDEYEEILAGK